MAREFPFYSNRAIAAAAGEVNRAEPRLDARVCKNLQTRRSDTAVRRIAINIQDARQREPMWKIYLRGTRASIRKSRLKVRPLASQPDDLKQLDAIHLRRVAFLNREFI